MSSNGTGASDKAANPELSRRRETTATRITALKSKLTDAERLLDKKACVYATGSYGRGEASNHSDLDLFIVGKRNGQARPDGKEGSALKHLDEILVKADLIEATRALEIQEFSGDGRYLTHYSVHDFTKTLGTPEDDVTNTFTARLLLLLESCPLTTPDVYDEIIEEVITAYWRDFEDHRDQFIPAFLANDILRLWRTFCVNYEARTERQPDDQKAKGKLKNYKLKHSRILTCYSALLYLLAIYRRNKTVRPQDAIAMIKMTPTTRLEWLKQQNDLGDSKDAIERLLAQYDWFLGSTNAEESILVEQFKDKDKCREFMTNSYTFGDLMFESLQKIGDGSTFYRLLVV